MAIERTIGGTNLVDPKQGGSPRTVTVPVEIEGMGEVQAALAETARVIDGVKDRLDAERDLPDPERAAIETRRAVAVRGVRVSARPAGPARPVSVGRDDTVEPQPDPVPAAIRITPRDPVWAVNAFSGQRNRLRHNVDNARGYQGNMRGPFAASWLAQELFRGVELGASRAMVMRPSGTPGVGGVPGVSLDAMSPDVRAMLPAMLRELRDRVGDIDLGAFIGSSLVRCDWLQAAYGERGTDDDPYADGRKHEPFLLGDRSADARDHDWRNVIGGLLSLGMTFVGIDNGASMSKRRHFIDLVTEMAEGPTPLSAMPEAFPRWTDPATGRNINDGNDRAQLDPEQITMIPWLATEDYLRRYPDDLTVDPERTRLFVWFEGINGDRGFNGDMGRAVAKVHDVAERGFIPVVGYPKMLDAALESTIR